MAIINHDGVAQSEEAGTLGFDMLGFGHYGNGNSSSTIKARDYKNATDLVVHKVKPAHPDAGETPQANDAGMVKAEGSKNAEDFCVVQKAYSFDPYNNKIDEDVQPTMGVNCGMSTGRNLNVYKAEYCIDYELGVSNLDEATGTLMSGSKTGGGHPLPAVACKLARWIVRRLTPTECERLQGFPDGHTDITVNGKRASDSPRYKALGNSMAIPNIEFCGMKIAIAERERKSRLDVA